MNNKIKSFFSRRSVKIIVVIVVVLIVARLLLPTIVLRYVNKSLSDLEGYHGKVKDIDIALIRGAYVIDSIYINKIDSVTQKETPFFASHEIDLSVEWQSLFHGSIVGELVFESPTLRFTREKVEPNEVKEDSTDFKTLLDDFMPLRINRCEIVDGRIQYMDNTSNPKVDVQLESMYLLAQNLRNSYDSSSLLPARIRMTATLYEGTLECNVKLNPLADDPTFDMNAELKDMNLVKVNDFLEAYAKVDVNKGTFGLYTEVAAKEGSFNGYVKPLIKDIDVVGKEDRDDNVLKKLWEAIAGGAAKIFENPPEDQVGTKIPFKGEMDNPKTNIWYTISNVLQNAFIRALQPTIDNEINIQSVESEKKDEDKNFFEKIFDK